MGSGSISLPCSGFFSPFPHGTGSLSVSREYLALPDGPGRFAQDFSCPALLRILLCRIKLRVRGCHPLWPDFPDCSSHSLRTMSQSYNPAWALLLTRFGLFPGRSPLLGESLTYFLFLSVLRCFSSRGWLPDYCRDICPSDRWVVPFGHPWIKAYLQLPMAFRSLSRPSSPP